MDLPRVKDIRQHFVDQLAGGWSVTDKSGVKTVELIGTSFIADEPAIFGTVNEDYVKRELEWYESQSLYVTDIPGGAPKIWQDVASKHGRINSNYGWAIFSEENHRQYERVYSELVQNVNSRRAVMIYTRPSMHLDFKRDGMSDFMCTNTVQYLIRDNQLYSIVQMRSNDAWAGFRNDRAWQTAVQTQLAKDLGIDAGPIIWNAGSLHVYSRQFYLIDHCLKTGEVNIAKDAYRARYPDSPFAK